MDDGGIRPAVNQTTKFLASARASCWQVLNMDDAVLSSPLSSLSLALSMRKGVIMRPSQSREKTKSTYRRRNIRMRVRSLFQTTRFLFPFVTARGLHSELAKNEGFPTGSFALESMDDEKNTCVFDVVRSKVKQFFFSFGSRETCASGRICEAQRRESCSEVSNYRRIYLRVANIDAARSHVVPS